VADVSADGEGKVTSDGTGGGSQGVGGTQDGSTGLDGVQTLPDHTDDGTRVHVLDQTGEEGLLLQVGVVVFQVFLTRGTHLQTDELMTGSRSTGKSDQVSNVTYLVASLLESGDDFTDESSLDTVRLDVGKA
jgi:hypothetical protein